MMMTSYCNLNRRLVQFIENICYLSVVNLIYFLRPLLLILFPSLLQASFTFINYNIFVDNTLAVEKSIIEGWLNHNGNQRYVLTLVPHKCWWQHCRNFILRGLHHVKSITSKVQILLQPLITLWQKDFKAFLVIWDKMCSPLHGEIFHLPPIHL